MSLFYGQDMFGNFPTQPNVGRMPPTTPQQQPQVIPLTDRPAQQGSGMYTATNPINYTGTTASGTMDKLAGAAGIGGLLLGANPMNVLAGGLSYTAGQEGIDNLRLRCHHRQTPERRRRRALRIADDIATFGVLGQLDIRPVGRVQNVASRRIFGQSRLQHRQPQRIQRGRQRRGERRRIGRRLRHDAVQVLPDAVAVQQLLLFLLYIKRNLRINLRDKPLVKYSYSWNT